MFLQSAEDVIIRHTEIPMDPIMYGVIAMGVFIFMDLS